MAKKLVVSGLTGTIFDAVLSKTPGVMTNNRTDRTDECISAVAEHMKTKADCNEQNKGFWQYQWDGIGTLTWEQEPEKKKTNADRIRSMSDEELAEFIEQISADSMDTISFGTKYYEEIWEHKETALKWLQSEVEESDER